MLTQAEIDRYLIDYAKVTGSKPTKFVCPMTLEPCELNEISRGHIINKAIPYAHNRTVPVRTQPDNFYGTRVESSFIKFAKSSSKSALEMLRGRKQFEVKFREHGRAFKAFLVPDKEVARTRKYMPVIDLSSDGESFFVGLPGVAKDDPDLPTGMTGRAKVTFTDKWLPAHWVASMLKVAHLTMFDMIGYRSLFDPSADVLRRAITGYFYDKGSREDAPKYFKQFQNAVKVIGLGTVFSVDSYVPFDLDTLRDRKLLCHFHAKRHFAATLLYRLPDKTISVTVPQTTHNVDIAVATRLYNSLIDEDEAFSHDVFITHFDGQHWIKQATVNAHFQPPFDVLEVKR